MSDSPKISITEIAPNNHALNLLKRMVADCSADWQGLQTNYLKSVWELWFTSRVTGHHLKVEFNPLSFRGEELHAEIYKALQADSETAARRKVSIPVRDLKQLADKLLKLSEEIDALYEEKQ